MKLRRDVVGRRVEITWRDPFDWSEEGETVDTIKGRAHPPLWTHQGVVEDLTDGWVRVRTGTCTGAHVTPKKEGVAVYEDLIETLVVLEERPKDEGPLPPVGTPPV